METIDLDIFDIQYCECGKPLLHEEEIRRGCCCDCCNEYKVKLEALQEAMRR